MKRVIASLLACCLILARESKAADEKSTSSDSGASTARAEVLRHTYGTYCRPPRLDNGRVDVQRLVDQLIDIHANTYSFCIHTSSNDWADLQLLLPVAARHGIRVWGSIVPPSESPPRNKLYAEPFRLDYERWAIEFARLSLRETNLVAWSIDDFSANLKFYNPEYLGKILSAAHSINPRLAFVPCCYFKAMKSEFVKTYRPLLDGFLFPYRHESGGANLTDADLVVPEVQKIKELTGPGFPVLIDVYATAHSRLGKSTPQYVRDVMTAGNTCADGVMVYCHQDPIQYPEKYQIVKELFSAWSTKAEHAAK